MMILSLALLCSVFFYSGSGDAQPIDIRFAYFTSGPEGGFDSSGSVPAVEIAQEQILRNTTILDGYRLSHTAVQDTMCNRTQSLNQFFNTVPYFNPPVLGLLGCGCSVASEPVAEIIHHWNISQVAYVSSSVTLSDRSRFLNFFRTAPSDATLVPAISTVLQYYGWRRVAFITQMEDLFESTFQIVRNLLVEKNITTRNRVVPERISGVENALADSSLDFFFEEDDYRVFFINTYSETARIILCEAYKRNFIYPRYAWLTYGWYQAGWWTSEVSDVLVDCSDEQLASVLPRTLAVQSFPSLKDPDGVTDTGLTPNQFYTMYKDRLRSNEINYTFTFSATTAYDATWALALALDKTAAMVNDTSEEIFNKTGCRDERNQLVPLENFTYDNAFMGCVVRSQLQRTNFIGVSGEVMFDRSGTRIQSQVTVMQYRHQSNGEVPSPSLLGVGRVTFGFINSTQSFVYLSSENNDTVYPNGIPPDGITRTRIFTFHLSLVIVYYFLAGVGLAFTTVCLVFNFVFRKRKIVQLTSPNLNYIIIIGTYIMYFSIYIRLVPSTSQTVNAVRCNLEIFLNTVGYSLAFGTILAKMGRVYYIFHNPTEQKKVALNDWQLALVTFSICAVGLILAILQLTVPALRAVPSLVPSSEHPTGRDEFGVQIDPLVWQCFGDFGSGSSGTNIILIIAFVYFALLQIIGLVLAIQTRKVSIKVLNDSKYVAGVIYITSIVLVLLVVITFAVSTYLNVKELLFSGGLMVATTTFLALVFIPKMVSLYRDPLGEKIFNSNNPNSTIDIGKSGTVRLTYRAESDAAKISQLESRIKDLESLLAKQKVHETSNGNSAVVGVENEKEQCCHVTIDSNQKAKQNGHHQNQTLVEVSVNTN